MKSHLDPAFLKLYRELPNQIRQQARKTYQLWKSDPGHPSLHFKCVSPRLNAYSVRVGQAWRAVGFKSDDTIIWYWIGSHTDYDRLLKMR